MTLKTYPGQPGKESSLEGIPSRLFLVDGKLVVFFCLLVTGSTGHGFHSDFYLLT